MQNQKGSIILITIGVVAIIAIGVGVGYLLAQKSKEKVAEFNKNEIYSCSEDRECVSVSDGPCGCNSGGSATAINRQSRGEASELGAVCPDVISNDPYLFYGTKMHSK